MAADADIITLKVVSDVSGDLVSVAPQLLYICY